LRPQVPRFPRPLVFGATAFTAGVLLATLLLPSQSIKAAPDLVDWRAPGQVWHFSMTATYPCSGCDAYTARFYDDMRASGVHATTWNDVRQRPDWHDRLPTMVRNAHDRGMRYFGAVSNIWFWQEYEHTAIPKELEAARVRDPFGNTRVDNKGWFQGDATWYSTLDAGWERYLLSNLDAYIDSGADGLLVDEGAYVGELWDFRPALLRDFYAYLASQYPPSELDRLAVDLGFPSFAEFDYAKVWRDRLPPGTTRLTDQMWYDRWRLNIPLHVQYYTFLRRRTHEAMDRIITGAKSYARSRYGRDVPVAFNLNSIDKGAVPFLDLIDFVDTEFSYSVTDDWGGAPAYFPWARTVATGKLLRGLGLPAKFSTNVRAREEIAPRGRLNTGLYRTLIADGYAGGQSFYVEEGGHNIHTDFPAIAPWYKFVSDHPEWFRYASPTPPDLAVLQLWEQYESHPRRALNGTAAMLADEGWQFDVVFSGEDVYPEYPGVNRLKTLNDLLAYPVIVIPRLEYCGSCGRALTRNHAQLLTDYLAAGGRVLVFATTGGLDDLIRRESDATVRALYQKLRAVGASPGQLVRVEDAWPADYFQTQSGAARDGLTRLLAESGSGHPIRLDGDRRAVSAIATRNGDRLIVQLVNYDYDRATDRTSTVRNQVLRILGQPLVRAVAYTPDGPGGGVPLDLRTVEGGSAVTVPGIDPWTIVVFTVAQVN